MWKDRSAPMPPAVSTRVARRSSLRADATITASAAAAAETTAVGARDVRRAATVARQRLERDNKVELRRGTGLGKLELGEAPAAALQRELREELDLCAAHTQPLGAFDEPDARGVWVRQHAFALRVDLARQIRGLEGQTLEWHPLASLPEPLAPAVRRSIARWQQMT